MIIYGVGASEGKGRGRVKLVSSIKDFDLVEEGDVIVTKSATPDFVLILEKASCLIADEGGVTCHIAIVCRELNKPAIVGTNNGSQLLRNGQMVEYDCAMGIIKSNE